MAITAIAAFFSGIIKFISPFESYRAQIALLTEEKRVLTHQNSVLTEENSKLKAENQNLREEQENRQITDAKAHQEQQSKDANLPQIEDRILRMLIGRPEGVAESEIHKRYLEVYDRISMEKIVLTLRQLAKKELARMSEDSDYGIGRSLVDY